MKSFAAMGDKPKRKNTRDTVTTGVVQPKEDQHEKTEDEHEKMTEDKINAAKFRDQSKGHFDSGAAPRVGGPAKATQGGVPIGGTKKLLVGSRKNVRKNSASPQAKRSTKKLY